MTPTVLPTSDADSKQPHQIAGGQGCPASERRGPISWGRHFRESKEFGAAIYHFERVSRMAGSCQVCRDEAQAALRALKDLVKGGA